MRFRPLFIPRRPRWPRARFIRVRHGDLPRLTAQRLRQGEVITSGLPVLEKLKDGCRIVSHDFDMRGVKPKETKKMRATRHDGVEGEHTIYLWTVPLEKEKE